MTKLPPKLSPKPSCRMRATTSVPPPGVKGITRLTLRPFGQPSGPLPWAWAREGAARAAVAPRSDRREAQRRIIAAAPHGAAWTPYTVGKPSFGHPSPGGLASVMNAGLVAFAAEPRGVA